MCFSRASTAQCQYSQYTLYCLPTIKSFDLEGWAKNIAFPEGVETSCYHTATSERRRIRLKADYYYIALRGASIRRSQCGNSEAIVGVAVTVTSTIVQTSRWDIPENGRTRTLSVIYKGAFQQIPTSRQKQSLLGMTRNSTFPRISQ